MNVNDIRDRFVELYQMWDDNGGQPEDHMLEIIGASFIANDMTIFGKPNDDYIRREIEWYDSRSLNVNDFPGGAPFIWRQIASQTSTDGGWILSNYGFLLYDDENHSQYDHVIRELKRNQLSRQAVAIYTRPDVWKDQGMEGMFDFICTNAVHYYIRDNKLCVVVQMRSNDAIFGYRNDYAWQAEVQRRVRDDLLGTYPRLEIGPIMWQVANLHIYPRHFHLVEHYIKTGEYNSDVHRSRDE